MPLSAYLRLTRFYFREMVRGVPFLVITLAGMVLLLVAAFQADKLFDTTVYPVTRVIAQVVAGGFGLFFLILITFYAGELTWRERVLRLDQVTDALAVPTAATLLAKVTAVLLSLALLNGVLIVTGMFVQAAKGYFHFELPVYVATLFGTMFPYLVCLTFLAFFLHAIINNKFLGHGAVVLMFVATAALPTLGFERNQYLFGGTPTPVYSDMNGYGPFVAPVFWFSLYWFCFSTLLLVAALRLWVRGKDDRLDVRWRRGRLGAPARAVATVSAAGFVGVGAFLYYNTDILNDYVTQKGEIKRQALYETTYKAKWEKMPMPRVRAVTMDVDLHPETRRYGVTGTYRLENATDKPISEVALLLDRDLTVKRLEFGIPATPDVIDQEIGFRTYKLSKPLAPGAVTTLAFDLAYEKRGFPNGTPNTAIAANGTFLTMPGPRIGYQEGLEITDEKERRKQKLPPRRRMAPYTDLAARQNTYLGNDADWIDFEATVRTAPDQIALAPGYLQREWTENGRRCFHYKMDAPIRNFYSFLSARYAVKKDTWTGKDGKKVALEIYYHPAHTYNLDRMMEGTKAALTYCSENFSPYQFRQLRILEFPAYAQFAQSFPNTVPYSESIGFIARVNESAEDIDYPYYVTAHEVAHQWWAHQVLGGDVEGSEMLSESLAEYSALMILQRKYGPDQIRRFLRYDLDRYLRGRGSEREEENPLVKVQSQQYIHYPKGALVFYALADRIGEKRLNATLARFVKDKGFQQPPYTTGAELVSYLREDATEDEQAFLTDLFEKITLYDLRATEAVSEKLPNGRWRVTLTVTAAKHNADGGGNQTLAVLNDYFDVGVFARPTKPSRDRDALGKPLALQRHRLTKEQNTFTFEVAEEPAKAGIDPYTKLIDRLPSDNVTAVKAKGATTTAVPTP
jgi:Aminopeptidase N